MNEPVLVKIALQFAVVFCSRRTTVVATCSPRQWRCLSKDLNNINNPLNSSCVMSLHDKENYVAGLGLSAGKSVQDST